MRLPRWSIWLIGATATALLGACATLRSPGALPDAMSAQGHRREAKRYLARAAAQQKRFDPKARAVRPSSGIPGGISGELDIPTDGLEGYPVEYNPTKQFLERAAELREHARQHRGAAEALERFEDQACTRIPKRVRSTCPLLGRVTAVERLEDGVRLRLRKGVPRASILAHMRCHYAYGRRIGRKGMPACPLYLKGLQVGAGADPGWVEIRSRSSATAAELLRRSRLHVVPSRAGH